MGFKLNQPILCSKIAEKFDLKMVGPDILIESIAPLSAISKNDITFSKNELNIDCQDAIVITSNEFNSKNSLLISNNPRLTFAKIVNWLIENIGVKGEKGKNLIHPTVKIGKNCSIDENVSIGENTIISNNVVITSGAVIGKNCFIKSGTVIGEDGFGYEKDDNGIPIKFPHLGSVVIEDNVHIGSITTVVRGTLSNTIIGQNSKIDDHVHIAHNCIIGKNVFVIACAELSGGVIVEDGAWVGPNASVIQKVKLGENCLVGLGSVVLKNVESNVTVAGVPAKPLIPKEKK